MTILELFDDKISNVSETLLLTLYALALESQSKRPILSDLQAIEITQKLNLELSKSNNKLYKKLVRGKVDKKMAVHIALRAKRYDDYVREFLRNSSDSVVINIGCGLDTRYSRIDNGKVNWYDLDFPEVIAIKRRFFEETDRYHFIPSSVLDYGWIEPLLGLNNRSFLFVAEGVFMYLQQNDVKSLVLKLQSKFPGSELVCEVFNSFWLKKPLKGLIDFKLQRELHFGKEASFNFGIKDSREMEEWNSGIRYLDEWSYFDEPEEKLGLLKFFRHIELMRKTQWTIHYKLN